MIQPSVPFREFFIERAGKFIEGFFNFILFFPRYMKNVCDDKYEVYNKVSIFNVFGMKVEIIVQDDTPSILRKWLLPEF